MWRLSAACSATHSRTSSGSNTSVSTAAQWDQTDSRISAFSRFVCVILWPHLHSTSMSKGFCYKQKTWDGLVKSIRPHRILTLERCAYLTLLLISVHSWVFMATPYAIKSVFIHRVNRSSRLKPSLFVLCLTEEKPICNVFDHDERHRLRTVSCLEWSQEPWIYFLTATKPGDTGVFLPTEKLRLDCPDISLCDLKHGCFKTLTNLSTNGLKYIWLMSSRN